MTTRKDIEARFDAVVEVQPGADPFAPTEFGEDLMWMLVRLVCATAPETPSKVRAFASLEKGGPHSLDSLYLRLRIIIVDHVAATTAKPPTMAELAAWSARPSDTILRGRAA